MVWMQLDNCMYMCMYVCMHAEIATEINLDVCMFPAAYVCMQKETISKYTTGSISINIILENRVNVSHAYSPRTQPRRSECQ